MTTFGDELRRQRQRCGLTQVELARAAGLSVEAVSLLERGRRSPRMTTMRLLADAMELEDLERHALIQAGATGDSAPPPLPAPVGRLVGRHWLVGALCTALTRDGPQLLTLIGPGGVGKTRLAIEAARQVADDVPVTVCWLPVGGMRDPAGLLPALSAALGGDRAEEPTLQAVIDRLLIKQRLIVIDGAEQLLGACQSLCAAVLGRAGSVKLLVTSRARLRVTGEMVFPVPTLAIPRAAESLVDLERAPASALFLDRAPTLHHRSWTPSDVAAVARICRRLDGLPLALELAAARTDVLGIEQLADTLERTLDLLPSIARSGRGDLLDAVVGWSYRSLPSSSRRVFTGMAVFCGEFSFEACAQITVPGASRAQMMDDVSVLVARSLVVRAPDAGGAARFRMLPLISEFASARLEGQPDVEDVRRRHARYYEALTARPARLRPEREGTSWLTLLDREFHNVDRAVRWAARAEPTTAQRIVGSVWRWCYLRGRYGEGRAWAQLALAEESRSPPECRAAALAAAGMLAFLQCDYEVARGHIEECRGLSERIGDDRGQLWALGRLGAIARERGAYREATTRHEEAMAIARSLGDAHEICGQLNQLCFAAWLSNDLASAGRLAEESTRVLADAPDTEHHVWSLINRGVLARLAGDLDGAGNLLAHGHRLSESQLFPEGVAWTLNQRGVLARLGADLGRAERLQSASLAEHRRLGDAWRMAGVLDEMALIAVHSGNLAAASERLAEANRLRRRIGTPVPPVERPTHDTATSAVAAARVV